MLGAAVAPSRASTHAATAFVPLRLDREFTLSASTNSTMACRFISVASKAIGLPLYTARLVVGLNAATFARWMNCLARQRLCVFALNQRRK